MARLCSSPRSKTAVAVPSCCRFGWRSSFFMLAGVSSSIFLCSYFLVPETSPKAPKSSYLRAVWRTPVVDAEWLVEWCRVHQKPMIFSGWSKVPKSEWINCLALRKRWQELHGIARIVANKRRFLLLLLMALYKSTFSAPAWLKLQTLSHPNVLFGVAQLMKAAWHGRLRYPWQQ